MKKLAMVACVLTFGCALYSYLIGEYVGTFVSCVFFLLNSIEVWLLP